MPRPIRAALAPDVLDRNGIALIQTLTATDLSPILNGALASGYDLDAICLAQSTTVVDQALLLNGAVSAPHSVRGTAERLVFQSASDNTLVTYTIVGVDRNANILTEALTGSDAGLDVFTVNSYWGITSITADIAVTGNVTVGINGVATFATPQHITIWATTDESGAAFTITGTDRQGFAQTESITGPTASAFVTGVMNFATVTHVLSPAAATAVEIGVDGTCESGWLNINRMGHDFSVGLGVSFESSGAMTYSVQHTFDDVQTATFVESAANAYEHETLTALTAVADGNYTNPPVATRLAITAHTTGGATLAVIQAGN